MSKRKIATIISCAILLLSLIPIIVISKYNVPYYDDYNHGYLLFSALNDGTNFKEMMDLAIWQTINTYNGWQGSYTGIFLSVFQPGIFGEQYYGIGALILFGIHIIACLWACRVLFKKILNMHDSVWLLIGSIVAFFQIQFLPSVQEGFFWWSGGVMHTLGFDLCLVIIFTALKTIKEKLSPVRMIILLVLIILCAGCGYEVALFLPVGLITIMLGIIIYRKINNEKIFDNRLVELGIYIIVAIVFLMINIMAPGNAIRAEASGVHVSPILAIIESFIYSFVHVFEYTSIRTLFVALLVAYLTYPILKGVKEKFVSPVVFTVGMWCIFSTIFTPAIYGEHYVAAPRYLNVIYFFFYFFVIIEVLYLTWYYRENKYVIEGYSLVNRLVKSTNKYVVMILVVFVMGSGVLQLSYTDATSTSAFFDFVLGNANKYKAINDERFELLNDDTTSDVVLPKQEAIVRVFPVEYLTSDPDNNINQAYARYYGKGSVVVDE